MVLVLLVVVPFCLVISPSISQNNPKKLYVAYPSPNHQTQSDHIFLIGTAAPDGDVRVNGMPIKRSRSGNFAPSFPLQLGLNTFKLRYKNQSLDLRVSRLPDFIELPKDLGFLPTSLMPNVNISRLPNEDICFEAIATPQANIQVKLSDFVIPLAKNEQLQLPPNSAILTNTNLPYPSANGSFRGCTQFPESGNLGKPEFIATLGDRIISQKSGGNITILSPQKIELAKVIVESGVARSGAGSDFSRLTPLPKGTVDRITARKGDWVRLSYGGWIDTKSVQITNASAVPNSLVRSFNTRKVTGWTELIIPLQIPVPITITQGDRNFILTLHNVTAQTDTNLVNDDPVVERIDWQQREPNKVEYTIRLKSTQQWGYKVRYEGTSLILSLRHPPQINSQLNSSVNSQLNRQGNKFINSTDKRSLQNLKILLDPGHGSKEDLGARGGNGYPEKDVTLIVGKLLEQELLKKGAKVTLTRRGDDDIYPQTRAEMIEKQEPVIAISLHYNALPDQGDAENTKGIGTFWYHAQSHSLAMFIHNYLVKDLNRPSYGVFWNNLALARPTVAPSVLLELGFMINPEELEWIINPVEQKKLAKSLSDAIAQWVVTGESK
ncbi:N-acetylmuramoyl-L-alanine amidase [Synechococcus sp. PCC 7502]|uniref:N-acetylmuramoyl-L-alanine amidase n=1 Tax=Synechococcus sp. PCC 7502 TaxID=1173263 RepID=UPI00030C7F29|nr:N-acetylmuramoyl-L-alanine amidase [Synechococcus sp. PCC 7502]